MKNLDEQQATSVGGGTYQYIDHATQNVIDDLQSIAQLAEELADRINRFEDDVFATMKQR